MRATSHTGFGTALAVLALAIAVVAPSAHAASLPPPSEGVITNRPPPPVQGGPGKVAGLPCGIDGPAVDLGDGSRYPSGRKRLRAGMIFIDFSDAPADPGSSPREVYDRLVPPAERTLRGLSHGRFKLSVTPFLRWVRMPRPLSSYAFTGIDPYTRYQEYLSDALRKAARSFDLSGFKTVYVVAGGPGADPPEATTNQAPGEGIKAGHARILHEVTLTAYGADSSPRVMVHETGHVLGLPDLYEVGNHNDWDRFVGPWDIMSNDWLAAPMLTWTRRMVHWLDDSNFRCVPGQATVELSPVGSRGRIKAAVLRIGRRRAYVVEARSDSVGSPCPAEQGVLVYKWNGNVGTGDGPIHVIDAQPGTVSGCGTHPYAPFKPQPDVFSSYSDQRMTMTVVARHGSRFRVRIVRAP